MKIRYFVVSVILVLIIPSLILSIAFKDNPKSEEPNAEARTENPSEITLTVKSDSGLVEMELETYITGVVIGEMPADFELEALKAQAVAARTYTLRKLVGTPKHTDADICTDPSCCQAYCDVLNDSGSTEIYHRVAQAVKDTAGQVITCQGALIEATYFSNSGGKTEDAVSVWGADVPYLRSVDSPGEKNYENSYTMSVADFCAKLGIDSSENITVEATYTNGDGVKSLIVEGAVFSGVQARNLLQLPSTSFSVTVDDENVTIHTKGNGHRVGMSQYGADAMAVEGKSYREILAHYYTGTTVETYTTQMINAMFDKA